MKYLETGAAVRDMAKMSWEVVPFSMGKVGEIQDFRLGCPEMMTLAGKMTGKSNSREGT